jgi:hypothetical protein
VVFDEYQTGVDNTHDINVYYMNSIIIECVI